jgi:hypothetical protein
LVRNKLLLTSTRCEETSLDFLTSSGQAISTFPTSYLGLPLGIRKPSRSALHSLIQKVGNRLLGWARKFLTYPGRELLVKTVITAMPVHFLTIFKMPKWAITGVDRFRRSFFWRGKDPDHVKGGHCLVNWQTCLRPKRWGGLGKDLEKFGRAIRLRWMWHKWDCKERHWKHLLKIHDPIDKELLFSSTFIQIGDDKCTPFWEEKWLQKAAPNLFKRARFKNRSVHTELHNHNWIYNIQKINSSLLLEEYVTLYMMLSSVNLSNNHDEIIWRWTSNGQYSVSSAYECQFR